MFSDLLLQSAVLRAEMAALAVAFLGVAASAAGQKSFWAFYPSQRCGAELALDTAPARKCRSARSPEACRAACLSTAECGAFDTEGRLFTAASCGAAYGRVGGLGDLYLRQAAPPKPQAPLPQSKVEHFVVLYMENRPFDHILGCMVGEGELPGADGINGTMKLWKDANHTDYVNVTCGTAPYVLYLKPGVC